MKYKLFPPPAELKAGACVWAYLRDSGGPTQAESVKQQEIEAVEYCKDYHLFLERHFSDEAKSGGSVKKRNQFLDIIQLCEDEHIRPQALLIWNFARFGRDEDDSEYFFLHLKRLGVIVHSLTDFMPEDESLQRMTRHYLNYANAIFRKQNSIAIQRGLKYLVNMGKSFAPGRPPRGFIGVSVCIGETRDHKPHYVQQWQTDPALVADVRLAFELRAAGKSYHEITKATGGRLYKSSGCWASFFRNRSYIGYYGDMPDHHEMIVTHEVFDAVQKIMDVATLKRGLNHPRRVASPNLLSGFARCEVCGSAIVYGTCNKKSPWRYYMCGKKGREGYAACPTKRIGANNAEAAIMAAVVNRVLTVEYQMEVYEKAKKKFESTEQIEREIEAARHKVENLDIAIQRVLRTIEKTGSSAAMELLTQREAERTQAQAELAQLSAQIAATQIKITPATMERIVTAWRERLSKLQEAGNVREIQGWLAQFVTQIDLGYNKAMIHFSFKFHESADVTGKNTVSLWGHL